MHRLSALLLCLTLAACNTGGPGFSGIAPEVVTQDGRTFLFRRKGPVIEAIRTSPEPLPRFQPVARSAALAAQARTGCPVAWVAGDQAVMLLGLDCPGEAAQSMPKSRHWRCDALGSTRPVGERLVSARFALSCRRG